jgi:hypothetical protein
MIEELRAAFTEEILKRREIEKELEMTKTALWALVSYRLGGKTLIPDIALARKYKFNVYRNVHISGIVIEADVEKNEVRSDE